MTKHITHLVCDLDNTLYDWVGYFVPSFYAMVDELVRLIGCSKEELLEDFRETHRRFHDPEHAFAVLETRTVAHRFAGWSRPAIAAELDPAFHAYNRMRLETLRAYPKVHETLATLRRAGITLIAHSEAKYHSIVDRLSRLELFDYFSRIYCRERAEASLPTVKGSKSRASMAQLDKIVELKQHQRKPNPAVLLEICAREGANPTQSAFVGDSMSRDMLMARDAHVFAIWAQYGANVDRTLYGQLVRVSHWTDEEVEQEASLRAQIKEFTPDAVLPHDFGELLRLVSPVQPRAA